MGLAIGDFNSDARLDILKTHFADDIPALYRGLADGLFEDVATLARLNVQNRHVEWGAGMPDLDNDGRPDIFYVTGNVYPEVERVLPQYPHRGPRIVFHNVDGERFDDVSAVSGPGVTTPRSSRGAAFGDIDNDGDIDVLIMNMNEPPSLLRNGYNGANGWIAVQLQGVQTNPHGARRDRAGHDAADGRRRRRCSARRVITHTTTCGSISGSGRVAARIASKFDGRAASSTRSTT